MQSSGNFLLNMKYLSSLVIVVNLAAGCHGSYIVSSGSKTRSVSAPTNSVAPLATSGSHVALPTSSPASYSSAASDKAFSTSSPCASLASNSGLKDSENASKTYNSPSFSKNTVPKVAVGQKPTNTPFSTTTSVGAAAAPTKLVDPIKKSDDGKVAPAKDADAILQKHDPSKNVFDRPGAKKDLNDPNQGYRHKFGKNSPGHKKVRS